MPPTPTRANLKAAMERVTFAYNEHIAKVKGHPDDLQFSKDLATRQLQPVLAEIASINLELRALNVFSRSSIRDEYNSRIKQVGEQLAIIIAQYDTMSELALVANPLLQANQRIGAVQNLALQIPVVQNPPGQGSGNAISRSQSSSRTSSTPASSPSMYSQPSGIGSNVGPFAHTHSQAPSRHSLASQHSAVQPQMNPPGQGYSAISRSESSSQSSHSSRISTLPPSAPSMYSQPSGIGSSVGSLPYTHSQASSRRSLASQHSATSVTAVSQHSLATSETAVSQHPATGSTQSLHPSNVTWIDYPQTSSQASLNQSGIPNDGT